MCGSNVLPLEKGYSACPLLQSLHQWLERQRWAEVKAWHRLRHFVMCKLPAYSDELYRHTWYQKLEQAFLCQSRWWCIDGAHAVRGGNQAAGPRCMGKNTRWLCDRVPVGPTSSDKLVASGVTQCGSSLHCTGGAEARAPRAQSYMMCQ